MAGTSGFVNISNGRTARQWRRRRRHGRDLRLPGPADGSGGRAVASPGPSAARTGAGQERGAGVEVGGAGAPAYLR